MKKELDIFFTAVMFYTRIPCPKNTAHDPAYLHKASRYFPLIGWIVGLISFAVFYFSRLVFSEQIAVILAMTAGIFVTGAFHEDGFADVCDGFGGGWTKNKILSIMKDSAIGAYGAIGLVLLFLLKFLSLSEVLSASIINNKQQTINLLLFISAHSISRLTAVSITFTQQYAREDDTSKSKAIGQKYSWKEVSGAFVFGLLPLLVMTFHQIEMLLVLLPVIAVRFYMARYFQKWIGGYTGDCLGAVQQVSEVVFYLSVIALWKFI